MRAWPELAILIAVAACDHGAISASPAASATTPSLTSAAPSASASASPCTFDDAKVAALRAKVKTLKPGMTRAEVDRVLAVDWSCFGGGGQGSPDHFATGYTIAPGVTLALAWERKGDAGVVLASAEMRP